MLLLLKFFRDCCDCVWCGSRLTLQQRYVVFSDDGHAAHRPGTHTIEYQWLRYVPAPPAIGIHGLREHAARPEMRVVRHFVERIDGPPWNTGAVQQGRPFSARQT